MSLERLTEAMVLFYLILLFCIVCWPMLSRRVWRWVFWGSLPAAIGVALAWG